MITSRLKPQSYEKIQIKKMKYIKGDKKIYNEPFDGLSYYPTTGEVYHTNRSKSKFHKFYLDAIRDISAPKVLDVGCYVGTEIFMLPKPNRKASYWGIDISPVVINIAKAFAKNRGERNVNFQVSDGNKPLKFSNKFFDVVYALELVEHLADPDSFFKEVYRVLKDGGKFIISTPNDGTFLNKIIKLLPQNILHKFNSARDRDFLRHGSTAHVDASVWDHQAHISLWDFSKWKSVLERNGFTVSKVEGSSFYGGSRYISERPFLLGMMIMLDSLIDLLPLKPNLQMCMVLEMVKNKK